MTKPITRLEETPPILYKYRYFDQSGFHLRTLQNTELWFSSARYFDDPFDSSLHFDLSGLHSDLAVQWAQDFLSREFAHLPTTERNRLAEKRLQEIRSDPHHTDWFNNHIIRTNYNKFGICSLTPFRQSLLMWAHYADHHKGFCVGINMSATVDIQNERARHSDLIDLHKVDYAEEMPQMNFFQSMLSGNGENDLMTLITTKSRDWIYEQEYRLIRWDNADSSISIGCAALAEVILGCRISSDNRDRILSIVQNNGIHIPVYQAYQEDFRFSLRLEHIN